MDFPSVINRLFLVFCCFNFLFSFAFLAVAIVYRRQCFNFPTLLACNTALGVLLFSATVLAINVYMFIWDQYTTPHIDSLCPFRAYLYHSTIAWVHHSLILQAMEKYCKIRRVPLFKNRWRQVSLVLFQWIFDFIIGLPAFVTGNMVKVISDNLCFVSLLRVDLVIYMASITFFLTDTTLNIIYHCLVRHIRQVASRAIGNRETQMRRDLIMVRRIVLLNFQLAVIGMPVLIFVILTTIRPDLLPPRTLRSLMFIMNVALTPMLFILFWITPDLRESILHFRTKLRVLPLARVTPVRPVLNNQRF